MKAPEYLIPDSELVFPNLTKEVIRDKREPFFPEELRDLIYALNRSSLQQFIDRGEIKDYFMKDLNNVVNIDMGLPNFNTQPPQTKLEIKNQFVANVIRLPLVMFKRKENIRFVLTDRYSMVYNFRFLRKNQMKVIETST